MIVPAPPAGDPPRHLQITTPGPWDGVATIALAGELDLAGAPWVEAWLRAAELTSARIVCDLRSLTFIDASGIGALVESQRRHLEAGRPGPALLVRPGPVRRLLALVRIHEFLDLTGSERPANVA